MGTRRRRQKVRGSATQTARNVRSQYMGAQTSPAERKPPTRGLEVHRKIARTVQPTRAKAVEAKAHKLCRMLRHTGPIRKHNTGKPRPSRQCIAMDSGGWVSFSQTCTLLGLSPDELVHIVRADNEGRFQLLKARWRRPDGERHGVNLGEGFKRT